MDPPPPPDCAPPPSALVVGASGGIGAALVAALLARGGHGVVHAWSRPPRPAVDPRIRPDRIDLENEASIAAAVGRLETAPSLVIVAAGLLHDAEHGPERSLRALDPAWLARSYAVNAIGPLLVAKHLIPRMPRDAAAAFAALSARVGSISDNRLGGWHAYRMAKAALNMGLRNLAIEAARTHPRLTVAGLHPGTVDTPLSKPFQRGVPTLFTPDYSANRLLDVLAGLDPGRAGGGLFAWDGTRVPA